MKKRISLAVSLVIHAGVILAPLADPARAKMLDIVAVTFPENFPVPAASADELLAGIDEALPGLPAVDEPDADPVAAQDQIYSDPAPAVEEPAQAVATQILAPLPAPVVEAPAPVTASVPPSAATAPLPIAEPVLLSRVSLEREILATRGARDGAVSGATSAPREAQPNSEGIGSSGGGISLAEGSARGSVEGGGTRGFPSAPSRSGGGAAQAGEIGGSGGGGAGSPAVNHLAIFRAAVARKVGAEAERRFQRRAVREDEGLVKIKARIHSGGCIEIIAVLAEKPLLSDIIDDAVRAVEAPAPPPELSLPVEISFRFRFVLE